MARLPLSVIERCNRRLSAARIIDSPGRCGFLFSTTLYCRRRETATLNFTFRPGIERPGGQSGVLA
jgi:hypothetical protein